MLGLGWTEMLVIGVVALIFIGPKDLPVVMNRVGKVVGQIQRMGREFQREINKSTGLDEVRNLRNSITAPLKQTADEIRREFNTMNKDGTQSPSGVIKPSDPKVESVADEIRAKAGMPAAPKSSTELAMEYGFKSTEKPAADLVPIEKLAPVKATRKRVTKPAHVATADSEHVEVADTGPVPVVVKPARKRAAKPPTPVATEDAPAAAPKKPRAPRKKPADPAGDAQ
ncbi:Sec-independent protein translocase protein TatB [Devosia rhizoryzae]|uniref:Sec-independent protein translocase protein TatB n=1 Tax=Devosia rhizoryzae TaxID=2774137 RepID=A0ABX7C973_9HYPH|nr:Sec-independent protein translocase protein TatB [Devosia rhizoryzae]QQR40819.1 twin-arginine translocase subunit TatB [Devosia rhizoryzae]